MKMLCLLSGYLLTSSVVAIAGTTLDDPKTVLKEHGVRVLGSTLTMEDEGEFRSQVAKAAKVKRAMHEAAKKLAIAELQILEMEQNLAALTAANIQINAQLTNTDPNSNAALYNQLVGANNANVGSIKLRQQQLQAGRKEIEQIRAAANQAQEDFIQYVLETRALANAVEEKRQKAAQNEAAQAAVRELNSADDREYTLDKPSRAFSQALQKLEDLEAMVLSEDIAIRADPGGTGRVSVVVNGEDAIEMVIDSGASIITLPADAAAKLNVVPGPGDPPITLVLADGSQITGTRVKLKTVRVGQFEVPDVDCAVLGRDAINADPLLGMSFLKNFEFRINSAERTLTLTHIEEGTSSDKDRRR
ncbi:MAG: retropepsin-like aspartic protease [Planctomycetaceae bacterium]